MAAVADRGGAGCKIMNHTLLIVESPAKAKTIQKYLGKGFTVKASVGHVIDLPKTKLGVDIEHEFAPEYVVIRGKNKVLKELLDAAKKSDEILLATDLDREGEAIAWHIGNHLAGAGKPIHRIIFNEITKSAITRAVSEPGVIDERQVNAQQARRILDRLVGYLVSPQLWSLFYKGLSAGRVQSVALRLVCERETEIEAFVRQEYWTIHGRFAVGPDGRSSLDAELVALDGARPHLADETAASEVAARARGAAYTVQEVVRRERKRSPRPPFITSTLQQEAAGRHGFSAKKTMALAQALYEGVELGDEGPVGLITYMRTDSVRLSADALTEAQQVIGETFGAAYQIPGGRIYKAGKKAQDAHEAIRPTAFARTPESLESLLPRDLLRVYQLVWQRTVASQMPDALLDQTTINLAGDGLGFRASGSVIAFPGFLRALPDPENSRDPELPTVEAGEPARLVIVEPKQHFTQPPPRYRDASLVRELEASGIGRPSTYAAIISTLIDRGYVDSENRQFTPTRLGREVWGVLGEALPHLFAVKFTATMEDELDRIESGEVPWQRVVREFYEPFRAELDDMERGRETLRARIVLATDIPCPKCGTLLVEKWGSNGKFIACPKYPECRHAQPLPDEVHLIEEPCPDCGKPLQVRSGRFGAFIACTGYPDCKHTRPIPLGVPCPKCGGDLAERRSKRGKTFYGCTKYPACDFVSWNRPVARACEACANPYLVQKYSQAKGRYLACPACKAEALE
jgi:DNA topoisomerase-1